MTEWMDEMVQCSFMCMGVSARCHTMHPLDLQHCPTRFERPEMMCTATRYTESVSGIAVAVLTAHNCQCAQVTWCRVDSTELYVYDMCNIETQNTLRPSARYD